jgi:acetolactate synthase small subunit
MSDKKVKIKLNIKGIDVELEAEPEQIKKVITDVIDSLKSLDIEQEVSSREFYASSCKEAVEKLWREGWFSKPRRLSEVYEELSRRGFNFDRSAISHALSSLVREGVLTRMGRERRYEYIQKIPYKIKDSTQ